MPPVTLSLCFCDAFRAANFLVWTLSEIKLELVLEVALVPLLAVWLSLTQILISLVVFVVGFSIHSSV